MTEATTTPMFAVVGPPNYGKSSIVATLAADESVEISDVSGTTVRSRRFPMVVDRQELYALWDTPGFQRPRQTLAWLREHRGADAGPADHPRIVRAFVEAHRSDERFAAEVELLTPILQGAGILYVMDGSAPYSRSYEDELEVLRWTGQPRIALINPFDEAPYVGEWEAAFRQHFANNVVVFNPLTADFQRRLDLLEAFKLMDDAWRGSLQRAIDALRRDRTDRHARSARAIAQLVADAVAASVQQGLPDRGDRGQIAGQLRQRYEAKLRRIEQDGRQRVEAIYDYRRLQRDETELTVGEQDLFAQEQLRWFSGPRWRQVVRGATLGGGAAMGIDALFGGLASGVPTLIGAGVGGVGALVAPLVEKARLVQLPGGRVLRVGPSRNIEFARVVLNRAMLHRHLVARRTHATRGVLHVPPAGQTTPWDQTLDDATGKALVRTLSGILRDRTDAVKALAEVIRTCDPDADDPGIGWFQQTGTGRPGN